LVRRAPRATMGALCRTQSIRRRTSAGSPGR
jgi:hypothetical protein